MERGGGEGESGSGRCAVTHITRLAYTTSSISTSHAAASRAKPRRARDDCIAHEISAINVHVRHPTTIAAATTFIYLFHSPIKHVTVQTRKALVRTHTLNNDETYINKVIPGVQYSTVSV